LGEVGIDVGATVGIDVGLAVGAKVGHFVGIAVGAEVGLFVGMEVGAAVGFFVGTVVRAPVGLKVGAELGRSSTKKFPFVLSLEVTFTVIELRLGPLSLSPTSTNPGGVTSTTVYTPGGTPVNTKSPLVEVVEVAMEAPLGANNSRKTPAIGSSPMLSLLVSSSTDPVIVRVGSSTKSLAVELSPAPRTT